jgi:4-amino-4-deoxy-L-arabinose transferase-like glycosyltransferase
MLVAAALRLGSAARHSGLTMDSPLYVRMAEALAAGHAPVLGPAHYGYPALVALAGTLIPGRELPGRAVSLVASLALVAIVFRLARTRLSAPWAGLAAMVVALHPLLIAYGSAIMTESAFLALVTWALLLLERRRFLTGGLALGASYLVRPEAAVIALGGLLFGRPGWRGAASVVLGIAMVTGPYLGWMRIEHGVWELTPKVALLRPHFDSRRQADWRLGDEEARAREPRSVPERLVWAAPSIVTHYVPLLREHLRLLLQAWPWPLLLLSAWGLAAWRGVVLAPLLLPLAFPILELPLDVRFIQTCLPALALAAAGGGAMLAARWPGHARQAVSAVVALAVAGLVACWLGPAGWRVRQFDDGPILSLRVAAAWLHAYDPSDALVMDRKVYVPFFAGMRLLQMPDDDYETTVEYARARGARYLVLEEYASNLRPQMRRLASDPDFQALERRLRLVYFRRDEPHTGVAIFEVVRDSSADAP